MATKQVFWLRIIMLVGVSLIVVGHIVLIYTFTSTSGDYRGFIIGAACSAIGIVLSLPTKIYLTLVLMEHEHKVNKQAKWP
jgi:hypothetical protein